MPDSRPLRWLRALSPPRLSRWVADHANPIVVKELRQAVRSRAFVGLFMLLLGVCVVISLAACGRGETGMTNGSDVFAAFLTCMSLAGMVVMPMLAFHALGNERMDNTYELLNVSGLGPRRIVRGKLGAMLLQLGLIVSAFVPFMAFTYFLRGISIPEMLVSIACVVFLSAFLILAAVTASTLAPTKRGYAAIRVIVFLSLVLLAIPVLDGDFVNEITREFMSASRSGHGPDLASLLLFLLGFILPYVIILYQLAVSRLTFPADNRSTGLRAAFLFHSLVCIGAFALNALGIRAGSEEWTVLGAYLVVHWGVAGVFMTTEPEGMSRRVERTIPRRSLLRFLATPLWPGRSRGWACLLLGLGLALAATVGGQSTAAHFAAGQWIWFPVVLASQFVILLGILDLLYHTVLKRWRKPATERAAFFILLFVVTFPPVMYSVLSREGPDDAPLLHALNPFCSAFLIDRDAFPVAILVMILGILVALCHVPAIARGYWSMQEGHRRNGLRRASARKENAHG